MPRARQILTVIGVLVLSCLGAILGYGLTQQAVANLYPPIYVTATISSADAQATVDYGTSIAATVQSVYSGIYIDDPHVFSSLSLNGEYQSIQNTEQGLSMTVKYPEYLTFTVTGHELPPDIDASVTAEGLPPEFCPDWFYSFNIRQQANLTNLETGNFYQFKIMSDATWEFTRFDPRFAVVPRIAHGEIEGDFDIFQPNTIRIVAISDTFELYINGNLVTTVEHNAEANDINQIGVGVETSCSQPASVLFTNLVVKKP